MICPGDLAGKDEAFVRELISYCAQIADELDALEMYGHLGGRFDGNIRDEYIDAVVHGTIASEAAKRAAIKEREGRDTGYYESQSLKTYRARTPKPGYVYLIAADNGTYKIGVSVDPKRRVKKMGINLPYELEVVHTIPTEDMLATEKALHALFADKRVGGEWFELDESDVTLVKRIENGADLDE